MKELESKLEARLGAVLRYGVYIAAFVIFVGACVYLYSHWNEIPDYTIFKGMPLEYTSIEGILRNVFKLNGEAILQLGVLLLIAVPVARVFASIFAFAQRGDYMYVVISLIVFIILLISGI